MNIALWNIERACASTPTKLRRVQADISSLKVDILVLTEASTAVYHPSLKNIHGSEPLPLLDPELCWKEKPVAYKPGEMRTGILTKYPILARHAVTHSLTNSCVDLDTPNGVVRVMATIVGILNTNIIWNRDFEHLRQDLYKLGSPNMVLAGDFNVPLPEGTHKERRMQLIALFAEFDLAVAPTKEQFIIDHIALGKQLALPNASNVLISPVKKNTSDHPIVEIRNLSLLSH